MSCIRVPDRSSKYYITKHEFLTVYHYALQYDDWKSRIEAEASLNAISSDGMPHGNVTSDPTYAKALKLASYRDKMRMIEETINEVDSGLYCWLLWGVTKEGCTYNYLRMQMNIPCGQNQYYELRRKFYYLLAKKIEKQKTVD